MTRFGDVELTIPERCNGSVFPSLLEPFRRIERFELRHVFARHDGTAPTPVWSGNSDRGDELGHLKIR